MNAQLEQTCFLRSREAPCHFHDLGRFLFDRQSRLKTEFFVLRNVRRTRDELHLAPRAKYYMMKLVRARVPKSGDVHAYTRRTKDGTLHLRESIRPLSARPSRFWDGPGQGPLPKRSDHRQRRLK